MEKFIFAFVFLIFLIYLLLVFVIVYHLIRFGIGKEPKSFALLFFFFSIFFLILAIISLLLVNWKEILNINIIKIWLK